MKFSHWVIFGLIVSVSLGMHLWHLGQPTRLISDEWYFVQDAEKYSQHQNYTDAHPPLGKLQMAAAIAIGGDNPTTWRIGNAISGTLLTAVVIWFVFELTGSAVVALLAGLGTLLDGFLLTESRSGLINLPYVLYGFAAIGCAMRAMRVNRSNLWIALTIISAGLSLSDKWLGIWLVIPALAVLAAPQFLFHAKKPATSGKRWLWLLGIPAIYIGVFVVHAAWLHSPFDFWQSQLAMLEHHLGPRQGHPYRELWWRWPLLWRPFPYWSELRNGQLSTIWSMPNPLLWWLGWLGLLWSGVRLWRDKTIRFVVYAVLLSWIPFAFIHRDMFIYHAFPTSLWLIVLLAMLAGRAWKHHQALVVAGVVAVIASFIFFFPWYMNLPLTSQQHELRRWLPTWQLGAAEVRAIRQNAQGER